MNETDYEAKLKVLNHSKVACGETEYTQEWVENFSGMGSGVICNPDYIVNADECMQEPKDDGEESEFDVEECEWKSPEKTFECVTAVL